jgi:hypothetical protein
MGVSFPTGHTYGHATYGTPRRASPCQCKSPVIDPENGWCSNCGKHLKQTINQTFHDRAVTVQLRGRQRKLKAA